MVSPGTTRMEARQWTEEEERLFREALELHGRNWRACASHIGSRNSKAVTSHAQKHFIKLCIAGTLLPPKVRESGEGYTLSGKLLDPESSAAVSYGFKSKDVAREFAMLMLKTFPDVR